MRAIVVITALLALGGCALRRPQVGGTERRREFSSSLALHGRPLELHLSAADGKARHSALVLYASGDGGWFGAAVDMFRRIGEAGYAVAGFSSRAFLKIERPHGALVRADQLADEYAAIIAGGRLALHLDPGTPTILVGWSRGAAFSVIAGSEPRLRDQLRGVVAIGLDAGEDLSIDGDDSDEGPGAAVPRKWPFETYVRLRDVAPLRCAVIQATRDNYLPAVRARELFGPDTAKRRFYAVDATNHRFSGGKPEFDAALVDALDWVDAQTP
jgi:hypothetical protein